jgi:predicted DNA repair protein MutK
MAVANLLALIDDIATLLDDVATLTKVAAKKTTGLLGDDLALNAEQVSGVRAERELPVVWAVAKGSLVNKAILVPAALVISAIAPWLIMPMLMIGGSYLCYEGFEKVWHTLWHKGHEDHVERVKAVADTSVDMVEFEKDKIKGAIRTDFILSAEIIVITLGAVATAAFPTKIAVLTIVAVVITIAVYGVVAAIVKIDDAGLYLSQKRGEGGMLDFQRSLGRGLLIAAPHLMRWLSIVGTIAMFLVGGGILLHGLPWAHDLIHHASEAVAHIPGGAILEFFTPAVINGVGGVIAGGLILAVISAGSRAYASIRGA